MLESRPKVAVVMSTYNGELYIREQLDSILRQESVEPYIFIRDDGSSDNTKNILLEYSEKYSNIKVDFGSNVGIGNSFMDCLYNVGNNYDYYAFSDQDDIWLEEKLIHAIQFLKKSNKQLYFSNQICVDKNGKRKDVRFLAEPEYGIVDILFFNEVSGCTFVFDKDFYSVISSKKPSRELLSLRIHDVWVALVGALLDETVYDSESYILYRQHENNVVGAYKAPLAKRIKTVLKKVIHNKYRNGRSKLAIEIRKCFPELANNNNKIINLLSDSHSFIGKIELLKNYRLFSSKMSRMKFFCFVCLDLL